MTAHRCCYYINIHFQERAQVEKRRGENEGLDGFEKENIYIEKKTTSVLSFTKRTKKMKEIPLNICTNQSETGPFYLDIPPSSLLNVGLFSRVCQNSHYHNIFRGCLPLKHLSRCKMQLIRRPYELALKHVRHISGKIIAAQV